MLLLFFRLLGWLSLVMAFWMFMEYIILGLPNVSYKRKDWWRRKSLLHLPSRRLGIGVFGAHWFFTVFGLMILSATEASIHGIADAVVSEQILRTTFVGVLQGIITIPFIIHWGIKGGKADELMPIAYGIFIFSLLIPATVIWWLAPILGYGIGLLSLPIHSVVTASTTLLLQQLYLILIGITLLLLVVTLQNDWLSIIFFYPVLYLSLHRQSVQDLPAKIFAYIVFSVGTFGGWLLFWLTLHSFIQNANFTTVNVSLGMALCQSLLAVGFAFTIKNLRAREERFLLQKRERSLIFPLNYPVFMLSLTVAVSIVWLVCLNVL